MRWKINLRMMTSSQNICNTKIPKKNEDPKERMIEK